MSATRRLIVMRHAKAEQHAATDHERRLTTRGERDALQAGRWLAGHGVVPDVVLVSSARRAQATAAQFVAGVGHLPDVRVLDELYAASPQEVLALAAQLPPDAGCAVVIGHNPAMEMAVQLLDSDPDSAVGRFPTSALAVFEVPGQWAALTAGSGTAVLRSG